MDIKVEIYRDKMVISYKQKTVTVYPKEPYSTSRLLVGTFSPAEECLKDGLQQIGAVGLFKLIKPTLNIKAKELCEGGLSEVEQRCLNELGFASGARKVNVN